MAEEQKRGFSEEALRSAVQEDVQQTYSSSTKKYLPYKEAIDYLLYEEGKTIVQYQESFQLPSVEDAYEQFFRTHQEVVLAQHDHLAQQQKPSFPKPTRPEPQLQTSLYSQSTQESTSTQITHANQNFPTQQDQEQLSGDRYSESPSLASEEKKVEPLLLDWTHSSYLTTKILAWILFFGLFILDTFFVGATPYFGDLFFVLLALGVWSLFTLITGFSFFRFALKLYALDLLVSVLADFFFPGTGIFTVALLLDALVEPLFLLRKVSPPQLFKKAQLQFYSGDAA